MGTLPGGALAPRADPRGAKRCLDERPCLGDAAQDVRNTPWTPRQTPELGRPQAHEHPASVLAASAPSPVFILLTITKAIYLFHLERDLVLVTSLECSVAFIPPATPRHVCASPVVLAGSCLWCVHTWAQVSLFDLQFPGGSALRS